MLYLPNSCKKTTKLGRFWAVFRDGLISEHRGTEKTAQKPGKWVMKPYIEQEFVWSHLNPIVLPQRLEFGA